MRNMADLEERPSKIRKLNFSENAGENEPSTNPAAMLKDDQEQSSSPSDPLAGIAAPERTNVTPPLSKSQQKKLKKKEEWAAGKDYRRAKRKEQHKAKVARKAEERKELQEKIASGEIDPAKLPGAEVKRTRPRRPIQIPVSFIIDCDFDEYMTEKEIVSLSAQLTRCYSDNKSNPYRAHLAMSSWGGNLKTRFETVLASAHRSWKGVRYIDSDFVGAAAELDRIMSGPDGGKIVGALAGVGQGTSEFALETPAVPATHAIDDETPTEANPEITAELLANLEPSIVYLSSDSPNTLERLSPNTSYIVGGIVDKNRHKGLCYKRACERGIATAKLPIGEYMTMQSRTVLTVNHVVEIMLKWLETGDWGDAFLAVIPKRKEARLKVKKERVKDESEDEDEDDDGVQFKQDKYSDESEDDDVAIKGTVEIPVENVENVENIDMDD